LTSRGFEMTCPGELYRNVYRENPP